MRLRNFFCVATALAATAAAPGVASAANFCVGSVPECTGSPVAPFTTDAAGITSAVAAANASGGSDNIFLAAGTYPLASALAPTFAASQDVHIIGAGVGQTVFTGSNASTAQLTLDFKTAGSDAKGFTLTVTGTPSNATGIQVFKGGITDFAVSQPGGNASNFRAVALDSDATARRGSISITSPSGVGVHQTDSTGADDGKGEASELTMTAAGGSTATSGVLVDAVGADTRDFDRLRISGFGRGIEVTDGNIQLTNSLIDMGSINNAAGIDAYNGLSNSIISADASRVTIVGTGPFQTALLIGAGAAGTQAFAGGFTDLVLFPAGASSTGLSCIGGGISVVAAIDSYAIRGFDSDLSGCNTSRANKTDLTVTDPGFRNSAAGDYRLKPGSPLVDAGKVGEVISSSERDLLGLTRVVDGDGDGTATVDLGAFEYQRAAPTVSAAVGNPALRTGQSFSFNATGEDADGENLSFAWTFDDGASATGATVNHAFASAGAHTATVTATDEAGLTASATVAVSVAPIASARVTAKPKKAFARTKKGFTKPKRKQPFFTVAFADAAKAKFTLQARVKGKLRAVRGSQTVTVKTGANKFAFGGTLGRKVLKAGRYRVTITPLGADGFAGEPVAVEVRLK